MRTAVMTDAAATRPIHGQIKYILDIEWGLVLRREDEDRKY